MRKFVKQTHKTGVDSYSASLQTPYYTMENETLKEHSFPSNGAFFEGLRYCVFLDYLRCLKLPLASSGIFIYIRQSL